MVYGVGGLEAIALRIIGNGAYEASPAVSANHDSMCFDYVARDDAEDATTNGRDSISGFAWMPSGARLDAL